MIIGTQRSVGFDAFAVAGRRIHIASGMLL
jgi:hypothetical protein